MTKCIKRIRDLFEYALYKFTLYLFTYLLSMLTLTQESTRMALFKTTFQLSKVPEKRFFRLSPHAWKSYTSSSETNKIREKLRHTREQ